jgi:hypothetical protein
VGVAKTLHLLAPRFFPPWDNAIARRYGCAYANQPARAYIRFCEAMRLRVVELTGKGLPPRHVLKKLDEYNYVRYTKRWPLR